MFYSKSNKKAYSTVEKKGIFLISDMQSPPLTHKRLKILNSPKLLKYFDNLEKRCLHAYEKKIV